MKSRDAKGTCRDLEDSRFSMSPGIPRMRHIATVSIALLVNSVAVSVLHFHHFFCVAVMKLTKMHAFGTLDVSLGQKVPKIIDFFILTQK